MRYSRIPSFLLFISSLISLTSCYTEDPGSLQESEKQFSFKDFDHVELGSAFVIEIRRSDSFSVSAKGDARNLDDLLVYVNGSTLKVKFDDSHNRKHETYIYISMPQLTGAKLSGASDTKITGFSSNNPFDFNLSGASYAQVDIESSEMTVDVSGASTVRITGTTPSMNVDVSGASVFSGFNLEASEAHVHASGASEAKVNVVNSLHANASGASSIIYRGDPTLESSTSGASSVRRD